MKQKRFINIFILITLFFLLLCPIRSEAATNKQQKAVKSQVTKYLDSIKKYDCGAIEKVMTNNAKKNLVRHSKPIEKVIRRMQKKWFTYKIKKIKISGNKATVTVSVSYYNGWSDYEASFYELLDDMTKDLSIGDSEDRIYKVWAKHMTDYYNLALSFVPHKKDYDAEDLQPGGFYYYELNSWKAEYKQYRDVKIPLVKQKGKWKISKNTKDMQFMTDCEVYSAHRDILKNKNKYKQYFILSYLTK